MTYGYSENVGTHFERPAATFWEVGLGESSTSPHVIQLLNCSHLNELKGWDLAVGGETASPWDLH